jgi:NAD(P)-dependent dehydrogenase (short-subunit alcohol dehydrogenase family)
MAAQRFSGRVALVTGAASGIGAATAALLAGEGATVYCADVNGQGAGEQAAALVRAGAAAVAVSLDVTMEASWAEVVGRAVRDQGGLDVLVNSAGISHAAPLADLSLSDWRRVFAVNVDGTFLGLKHAVPVLAARAGNVVNVSSVSGVRAAAGAAAYSTSKAAVAMLTRAAAKECRERSLPVRVNAVAPAGVTTPLWRTMPFFQDLVRELGSEAAAFDTMAGPEGRDRFATAEDVARAILFLASDDARTITGVELVVDRGYVL